MSPDDGGRLARRPRVGGRRAGVLLGAALLVAAVLTGCSGTTKAASGPQVYYVSRNGDGSAGTSWATAWNELDRIPWKRLRPGDRIMLDGGAVRCPSNPEPTLRPGTGCGMVYRTGLAVDASGTAAGPISIELSTAVGHNGTAVLDGGRSTPLPYCDQQDYQAVGSSRRAGIAIPGRSHVLIDGVHRSGIMVYGAQSGVDLESDDTSFVTLRDLEILDNGTYGRWAHGYRTDGEGIALAGHDIVIDRTLIHDNGQDDIQDTYTGDAHTEHAPLHDISVTNSWIYEHRESPIFPGFGFNSGAQEIDAQDCTHVDGIQIYGGGTHQHDFLFRHDVFGPLLAQGIYPGNADVASVDDVTVSDVLFLDPLDHAIIGDPIAADPSTPGHWTIDHVTSYLTDRPATGVHDHGQVDLAGRGHTLTDSILYNGYFAVASPLAAASGNVWWGGDPVPGGVHRNPRFASRLPITNIPPYQTLTDLHLTPRCKGCAGKGSTLHDPSDLLALIDALDRGR